MQKRCQRRKFWEPKLTTTQKSTALIIGSKILPKTVSHQNNHSRKEHAPKRVQVTSMNHIILTGRLTEDPKTTYSSGSNPVVHATFNFAVPDITKKRDEDGNYPTDFFRCTCWNRIAEIVDGYCCKGSKLLIIGRLKNNNYEKNGQRIYGNEILIDSLEFLEEKKQNE